MQVSSSTALISYDPTLPHISVSAYANKVFSSRLENLLKLVDEVIKNPRDCFHINSPEIKSLHATPKPKFSIKDKTTTSQPPFKLFIELDTPTLR